MIVAGELSGDAHAAKLVKSLREIAPETQFEFYGAASFKLREAGVEAIVNADDLAITGIPEIARALPMFLSAFKKLKREALRRKTDAVVLVDFPEFNLKLAKSLKKAGLKVIYYISPQIWAWRKYRLSTIKKYVDLLITILPFEKDWYRSHGVCHVEYVGSPLAREVHSELSKEEFCRKHRIDPARPLAALLPGSRSKEISKILPEMLRTAEEMSISDDSLQFAVALASTRSIDEVKTAAAKVNFDLRKLLIIQGETYDLLNAADVAAVASGTATLEAAIIGTPFAIVYKSSNFNYKLMRPLIDIEHFGLVNLIAGKRIVKEFIQEDFSAENLSLELLRLFRPDDNSEMRVQLAEVSEMLGHGGASKRAAEAIMKII